MSEKDFSIILCLQSVSAWIQFEDQSTELPPWNEWCYMSPLCLSHPDRAKKILEPTPDMAVLFYCCGFLFAFQCNLMNCFERGLTVYLSLFQVLFKLTCTEVRPSKTANIISRVPAASLPVPPLTKVFLSWTSPDAPCCPISRSDQCG